MKRSLSALFALMAFVTPALAQTRALPPGEIRANGDITFGNALKLGKREGNKTVITPDTLQILGSGSTGDASLLSAKPEGQANSQSLSALFRNYPLVDPSGNLVVVGGGQVGKFNGPVFQPLGDGSALSNVATVAPIPDLTGVTAANASINAAISAAAAAGKSEVILPSGTIMIDNTKGSIVPPSNMRIRGAGRGKTTIICNDAADQTTQCLATAPGSSNVHFSDFTLKGFGETGHFLSGVAGIYFNGCTDCSAHNIEVRYSRYISIFARNSNRLNISDNFIYRSMIDGINLSDTPNAIVSRNTIVGASDDAISAHTYDTTAAPVRSGLIISDNLIEESHGIRVLGAKATRISGNVMRRVMSHGIIVSAETYFGQGNTPMFGIEIANNVITDVFRRSETPPRTTAAYYIKLSGGPRSEASAGSGIPGWPNAAGTVLNPFGTGVGSYYVNNTGAAGTATPGGGWFNVHGNTLLRTLPATTAWSQWGYGSAQYVGNAGDGTGFYSGGIPESALNIEGIIIDGPLAHSRISDNLIRTTGSYGIRFLPNQGYPGGVTPPPIKDFDFNELTISGNKISDVSSACISFDTPGRSNQRISFLDNTCDGDPRFISAGRGSGGTWSNQNILFGLYTPFLASAGVMRGNTFRNVGTPLFMIDGGSGILKKDNIVYAHGSPGYSGSNTGVGTIPANSSAWTLVDEDGNPASPTFGWFLAVPTP